LRELLRAFIEVRRTKNRPLTAVGMEALLDRLRGFAVDTETQRLIVERSVRCSYVDFFKPDPPKTAVTPVRKNRFCNYTSERTYDYDKTEKMAMEKLIRDVRGTRA